MKIGEREIITPREDRYAYDLDWRAQIVDAIAAGGKLPEKAVLDVHMKDLLSCMDGTPKPDIGCKSAMSVKASPMMSSIVEAYLLTRASNSQIYYETGIPDGAVYLFELLYYNVRTRFGDPLHSQVLRVALELEAGKQTTSSAEQFDRTLKKAAVDGDIQLLRSILPRRRSELSRGSFAGTLVQRELNRRLLRGELSTSALIRLRGLEIAEDRMNLSLNKSGAPDLHSNDNYYAGDPNVLDGRMF